MILQSNYFRVTNLKIPREHRLHARSPLLPSESCDGEEKYGICSEERAVSQNSALVLLYLPLRVLGWGWLPWGQQWHWHISLPETISFFFSGTRILTTNSLITTRAIVSYILINSFTSSSPRCLGSCGTSFKKSPQRRFSQTLHPLGCLVSPCLGERPPVFVSRRD